MGDTSLFSINDLRNMEVIDINQGTKLGYIKDFKINCDNYRITAIILPSQKVTWFGKSDDIEIAWGDIKKIGIDVLLVDGSEAFYDKE